ncbi:MAG TPA: M20/M25/M40 family metallo-hydrolase [Steroidobacteraceae bacterium]|nr:M20/M25/M40 family metallo-hydrolase [Steroidobacteraceae bacterium]
MNTFTRRRFVGGALASGAAILVARHASAAAKFDPIYREIERRHEEGVSRLQEWIRQPSIAAENRGIAEGCALTMQMLSEAGFQHVEKIPTDGQPGIFATLDAGAKRTVALYFMYDVKQANPEEWQSPPWEARLVDMPGLGKVVMGRGAVNQKGPQSTFIAALHAIRGAGRKLPVNLVLVAEGEEEIGSPHFHQVVQSRQANAALGRCIGVYMPDAAQAIDGTVTISLGAKGVVELELVSSAEKWGRGPAKTIHSSNRARVDSPVWHLVQGLNTLVDAAGDPAIDGYFDNVRALTPAENAMLDTAAARMNEASIKKSLGVTRWAHDASWRQSLGEFCGLPTVNIEGLVGGYTGPGGMTILPNKAAAKLDLRLVPNMTREEAVAKLRAHLAKRGFADLEVNVTGGYDPTSTAAGSPLVLAQARVYRHAGIDPILWPRRAGSWPGYVFTGEPLKLAAGHFGLAHGLGAHAPNEYFLIESADSKLTDFNGAVKSHVDYLFALA